MLKIIMQDQVVEYCVSIIAVPEKAMQEAGYIQTFTENTTSSSKHEFHAMAQMAYYQYQDNEFSCEVVTGPVVIESDGHKEQFDAAVVMARDRAGKYHAFIHDGLPVKKMLEAAFRFCTRWVRLDI
ncbi:MAG: hypothetical protein V2I36_12595 [Desulfopila sp.]|jgi:hypothetical protein|nr:hypothetical protein [Desulfopila sp.]